MKRLTFIKVMLLIFLFFSVRILYANEIVIKISLELKGSNIHDVKHKTIIYEGNYPEIVRLINKAKIIRFGNTEKATILEGNYFVEFFDGRDMRNIKVQNNYWVYDVNRDKFLRCSILNYLRDCFINYLFINDYFKTGFKD